MHEPRENSTKPILIFPGGAPRSLEFLEKCQRENQPVIGASSLGHDPSRARYPGWLYLPYITEAAFDQALIEAISKAGIGGIYTANPVVWDRIHRIASQLPAGVGLVNELPASAELTPFRSARAYAQTWLAAPLPLASATPAKPALSEIELAALFKHADIIPGMCDHEKIYALCEIARYSVSGDLVEIGSWWGKSAFVLARLASCHAIGKLLCIDPWTNDNLVQHDDAGLVDSVSAQYDADEALTVFHMNLLPYNQQHINFLRMTSMQAVRHYTGHDTVESAAFGSTRFYKKIAILHIDGNHTYAAVKADVVSWCGLVTAGGWIIIDDYVWPYGDGPRRAGDEFLAQHMSSISSAFLIGSALFIQLREHLSPQRPGQTASFP
ncbi:methyltransferase family protein [Janthinobacterium sp. 61]|uniref:class I SAM-dependent methyltransferase n=1 Tax=Janthinobacterium sp. 61 TaxID=2035209 RepID=UPI000CC6FFEF|nr:class I SAM-dependent methyltransferase [Janthinobacterium sp. 61]PKV43510.1 methyltransferase family protein [Janthinobacterium sp. 61]